MNKSEDVLVSVIIPIFNVENYIYDTLQSVLNQSYPNLQIICVDDCSTDKSLAIINDIASRDSRIEIIRLLENRGVSSARNIGLSKADGDWIAWLDSDDVYHPKFIETLLNVAQTYECDVVECKPERFQTGSYPSFNNSLDINPLFGDGLEMIRRFATHELETSLWSKIFRRRLFDGFNFPEGRIYEEPYFYFDRYVTIKKIAFISNVMYGYRDTSASIMKQISTDAIKSNIMVHQYLLEKAIELPMHRQVVYNRVVKALLTLWQRVIYQNSDYANRTYVDMELKKINEIIDNEGVTLTMKERAILRWHNHRWFKTMMDAYHNIMNKK